MTDKPKMLEITDYSTLRALEANRGQLDYPLLVAGKYADASELRAWRASKQAPCTQSETPGEPK